MAIKEDYFITFFSVALCRNDVKNIFIENYMIKNFFKKSNNSYQYNLL